MPALFDVSWRLAEHPELERIYPEYLFVLHSMMRAAVSLMGDAVTHLEGSPRDQVSGPVMAYFERHLLEEEGHDRWVLEDLEELGVSREDTLQRIPPPTVAALVGAQYYWIRHHDPVALLGYMMVLEGYPARVEAVDDLAKRSGLPPAAFRTVREHAAADVDHSLDLDRLIDGLPLTKDQFELVCVNASMTVAFLVRCGEELLENARGSALAHPP